MTAMEWISDQGSPWFSIFNHFSPKSDCAVLDQKIAMPIGGKSLAVASRTRLYRNARYLQQNNQSEKRGHSHDT
jgi:hypothetical protein